MHSQHSKSCWEIASLTFIIPWRGWQEFDEISILYGGQMKTGGFEENCRHSSNISKSYVESCESHQFRGIRMN